ncbi:MAG: hypothetical protein R3C19_12705 [Planctomycetaceae bacterium]
MIRRMIAAVLATLFGFIPATALAQSDGAKLKIVESIWGFDGRVQPGHFNPVSLLIDNAGDEPVDATASFVETQGLLDDSGGKQLQQVYIAANSRRWVQFYPYIANVYQTDWRLRVGRHSFDTLQQPRAAFRTDLDSEDQAPQAVIFDRPDYQSNQPTTVKHFPEHIFPPYSTVTFGLHTVFLDHVPDWELPRQQAFMSWLKLGGRVHVLKDQRGDFPQFSGELAELSQPFDSFRVGSGQVTRHDVQRSELSADIVNTALSVRTSRTEQEELDKTIDEQSQNQFGNFQDAVTTPAYLDEEIFRSMRRMTQPEHSWPLIFLLAVLYIGSIFPGCWILSQKKQIHFLATYGAIAGLSLVFSLLFLLIGRRGYGESTTLHTLAVAHMEDDTHASLFQWNTLFVTDGDTYTAGGPDQESVYATASGERAVSAGIVAGNAGGMEMRIPPFSAQTFLSRRRVTVPSLVFQINDVELTQSGLKSLMISAGENFAPADGTVFRAIAGARVYRLAWNSDTRTINHVGAISRLSQFTQHRYEDTFTFGPFGPAADVDDDRTEEQRFYDEALPDLVRRSLLDEIEYDPTRFELPADRIRLLVYSPIPETLQVPTSVEARETGWVLFVKDLFVEGK